MNVTARHFWDGCERGELSYQKCVRCAALQYYPRPFCKHCGGEDMTSLRSRGCGTIYSHTEIIRAPTPAFRALVPYTIALVDLDVHHGNGTASIFADEPRVFTFSVHHQWNYPAIKPRGDLDVGLEDGVEDEEYMEVLREHLPNVLDEHEPELVIYLAGADPYEADQLGGLGLSIQGLRRRDEFVLRAAADRGIALAITLAGGYAIRPADTVAIHCGTVEAALA